jgi:hypothetical protein
VLTDDAQWLILAALITPLSAGESVALDDECNSTVVGTRRKKKAAADDRQARARVAADGVRFSVGIECDDTNSTDS